MNYILQNDAGELFTGYTDRGAPRFKLVEPDAVVSVFVFGDNTVQMEVDTATSKGHVVHRIPIPPPSATVTDLPDGTVHVQMGGRGAPDGSWLWGRLMDWCKKRGVAPANYDDLFAIVGESRAAQAPAPRVWQMPEGANLIFSINGLDEVAPGVRTTVSREPTVGKWYAGVNRSQPLSRYGATARYEGEGRWWLGTGARIDLYEYDYLQELV